MITVLPGNLRPVVLIKSLCLFPPGHMNVEEFPICVLMVSLKDDLHHCFGASLDRQICSRSTEVGF